MHFCLELSLGNFMIEVLNFWKKWQESSLSSSFSSEHHEQ